MYRYNVIAKLLKNYYCIIEIKDEKILVKINNLPA